MTEGANLPVSLEAIRAARARLGDAIYHSPCPYSLQLSRLCGCNVYCKMEHLQLTGSFKERGARNKLLLLDDHQKKSGVIAASAGNHGQAIAYHAKQLGIPSTVVMPKWSPLTKVANCRAFGAEVILHGDTYQESKALALELAERRHLTIVSGFDDVDVIAGQGTIGLEIMEDIPAVDAVVVPIGGGGLISGIAVAMKTLKPSVRVIGVEPAHAPTLYESVRQ
jgi:threonine dehydratase